MSKINPLLDPAVADAILLRTAWNEPVAKEDDWNPPTLTDVEDDGAEEDELEPLKALERIDKYSDSQDRDEYGRWTAGGKGSNKGVQKAAKKDMSLGSKSDTNEVIAALKSKGVNVVSREGDHVFGSSLADHATHKALLKAGFKRVANSRVQTGGTSGNKTRYTTHVYDHKKLGRVLLQSVREKAGMNNLFEPTLAHFRKR